jgi:membrane protein
VPGWRFQLALELLQVLARSRRGLTLMQLAEQLRVDPLQLEPLVETLAGLDWVGRLAQDGEGGAARLVLLADPARTPLAPLLQALLLPREAGTEGVWRSGRLDELTLADALSTR